MLFKEPSLSDLALVWQRDPAAFYTQAWEDTSYTCAEWSWMVDEGAYWIHASHTCVSQHHDGDSWWDWLCERIKGPALRPVLKQLIDLNLPASDASLTTYLVAYQREKTGQTASEVETVMLHLATPSSLTYQGTLGETPVAAACAIGEPILLRTLLKICIEQGVNWDTPNARQQGYWPLHFCVANSWAGGVKEMVKAGATVTGLNKSGQTPAQLAASIGWAGYNRAEREGLVTPGAVKPAALRKKSVQLEAMQMDLF